MALNNTHNWKDARGDYAVATAVVNIYRTSYCQLCFLASHCYRMQSQATHLISVMCPLSKSLRAFLASSSAGSAALRDSSASAC